MKGRADIDAGVCGFVTTVMASSEDSMTVAFTIASNCDKVNAMAASLAELGPINVYEEMRPSGESRFTSVIRGVLTGCCTSCIVPAAILKAMQVAAGLALPKDTHITIVKEDT
jgi:hypothetical protein